MALSLVDFKENLISGIHDATSQDEVKRLVDGAINALNRNKINGHIIARFVDKLLSDLDSYSPLNKEAQQWSNIQMARVLLHRVKLTFSAPTRESN